ncbi:MAG: type III pantothenate kinase, partial [Saprospiraceae bacterium]
ANSLAAFVKYQTNVLIIDFGTALTFTVVDSEGQILGVNIAPGVKIAIDNLMSKTSQLPVVDIAFPLHPLGTNTTEAIQNGVLIGYVGMVKYMIKVLKSYLDMELVTIATGGLSSIIYPHVGEFDYIEKNLTLDGLRLVGKVLSTK